MAAAAVSAATEGGERGVAGELRGGAIRLFLEPGLEPIKGSEGDAWFLTGQGELDQENAGSELGLRLA